MVTQRDSESWQTLGEVARREQEGVRLVSTVVTPKAVGCGGGRGAAGWNLGCLGFIPGLGGEMVGGGWRRLVCK